MIKRVECEVRERSMDHSSLRKTLKKNILENEQEKVLKRCDKLTQNGKQMDRFFAIVEQEGTKKKFTALGYAIRMNKIDVVRALLLHIPNCLEYSGSKTYLFEGTAKHEENSLLYLALYHKAEAIAELLYIRGAECKPWEIQALDARDRLHEKFVQRLKNAALWKEEPGKIDNVPDTTFIPAPVPRTESSQENKTHPQRPQSSIIMGSMKKSSAPGPTSAPSSPQLSTAAPNNLFLPSVPLSDPVRQFAKLTKNSHSAPITLVQKTNEQDKTSGIRSASEKDLKALEPTTTHEILAKENVAKLNKLLAQLNNECMTKKQQLAQLTIDCEAKKRQLVEVQQHEIKKIEDELLARERKCREWEVQLECKVQLIKTVDLELKSRMEQIQRKEQELKQVELKCYDLANKTIRNKGSILNTRNIELEEDARKCRNQLRLEKERRMIEEQKSKKVTEILLLTRKLKLHDGQDLSQGFKLIKKLGGGCNGIVFQVEIEVDKSPRQFALKMIFNFQNMNTFEVKTSFQHELEILNTLTDVHPNIIHIISHFTARPIEAMLSPNFIDPSAAQYLWNYNAQKSKPTPLTTQFFLTEYHERTLLAEFRSKAFDTEKVYRYARDLLDCFSFLYLQHIVHRDVKMDNIVVSCDDHLILIDFGESVKTDIDHCCPFHALRAGNQKYEAPEVRRARTLKSDYVNFSKQYSWEVGILLYEICCGDEPFEGYPEAPIRDLTFGPAFDRYPQGLKCLIESMLFVDASRRIGIREALARFDEIMGVEKSDSPLFS